MSDIAPFAGANFFTLFLIFAVFFWPVTLLVLVALGVADAIFREHVLGKIGMAVAVLGAVGLAWFYMRDTFIFWPAAFVVLAAIIIAGVRFRPRAMGKIGMAVAVLGGMGLVWWNTEDAIANTWSSTKTALAGTAAKSRIALEDVLGTALFRSEDDRLEAKLEHSPPGTECREVIGKDCQCGPFVLQQAINGKILENRAYTIFAGDQKVSGCTNAQGGTQAVVVKHTGGSCGISFETPPDPAIQCKL